MRACLAKKIVHCMCAAVLIAHLGQGAAVWAANAAPDRIKVRLIIDYGDGSERHFKSLVVEAKDATVQKVMDRAAAHVRGVPYKSRGKGATAFLIELDGVKNQGRGKNWVFRVNENLGTTSFGIAAIKDGDVVRWTFGAYRP